MQTNPPTPDPSLEQVHGNEVRWTADEVQRYWAWRSTRAYHEATYYCRVTGPWVLEWAAKHIPMAGQTVLDYGCGPGYLIESLAQHRVSKVFGLDYSPDSIRKYQQHYSSHPLYGGAQMISGKPWPVADGSIDIVIAMEVLEHLNDAQIEETLAEFRRILRPGGYLLVTTPNEEDLESMKYACPCCGSVFNIWQHLKSFSAASLSQILQDCAFRVQRTRAARLLPPSAALLERLKNLMKRALGRPLWQPHLVVLAQRP
jgi:2-polyprenyl-3-methyl-5-hydroxy-6-metoxy-1,4-benzoquinol methylase